MDPALIGIIASGVVTLLSTAATKLVEAVSGEAGKQIGEAAGEKVGELFETVEEKAPERPGAKEAVTDLVRNPDDDVVKTILEAHLKKLMSEDEAFAERLQARLEAAKPAAEAMGVTINVGSISGVRDGGVVNIVGGSQINQGSSNPAPRPRRTSDKKADGPAAGTPE